MTDDEPEPVEPYPEPLDRDDGTVAVAYRHLDTTRTPPERYVRTVEVGTWECERCPEEIHISPTNGRLQKPHECAGCERTGPFTHKAVPAETARIALRAADLWHPPTSRSDDGFDALWDDVNAYLRAHWDAGDGDDTDAIYAGLTAFTLSTWVRPNLTFVPHLMLLGKTTGGKTRLLNTLARVCYRAVVTASATPASMFRLIDEFDVSFFVSEYHGLAPDTRRGVDAVVRAGQKRGEVVTRAEQTSTGYVPEVFDPFAHIAVATQFDVADDIKNRCVQVRSSEPRRDMPPTLDETTAADLRDRLLGARYHLLEADEWATAEDAAYGYLAEHDIDGRTREKLLSLLTAAIVWARNDPDFGDFVDLVVDQDREAAADSDDAIFVKALRDLAFDAIPDATLGDVDDPFAAVAIPLSTPEDDPTDGVTERFNTMSGAEKSPRWAGHVAKRLDLDKEQKRDGVVIRDDDLGPKLQRLCDDLNLGWERLDAHRTVTPLADDERGRSACSECGELRTLTHRHADGYHLCDDCADDWEDADDL